MSRNLSSSSSNTSVSLVSDQEEEFVFLDDKKDSESEKIHASNESEEVPPNESEVPVINDSDEVSLPNVSDEVAPPTGSESKVPPPEAFVLDTPKVKKEDKNGHTLKVKTEDESGRVKERSDNDKIKMADFLIISCLLFLISVIGVLTAVFITDAVFNYDFAYCGNLKLKDAQSTNRHSQPIDEVISKPLTPNIEKMHVELRNANDRLRLSIDDLKKLKFEPVPVSGKGANVIRSKREQISSAIDQYYIQQKIYAEMMFIWVNLDPTNKKMKKDLIEFLDLSDKHLRYKHLGSSNDEDLDNSIDDIHQETLTLQKSIKFLRISMGTPKSKHKTKGEVENSIFSFNYQNFLDYVIEFIKKSYYSIWLGFKSQIFHNTIETVPIEKRLKKEKLIVKKESVEKVEPQKKVKYKPAKILNQSKQNKIAVENISLPVSKTNEKQEIEISNKNLSLHHNIINLSNYDIKGDNNNLRKHNQTINLSKDDHNNFRDDRQTINLSNGNIDVNNKNLTKHRQTIILSNDNTEEKLTVESKRMTDNGTQFGKKSHQTNQTKKVKERKTLQNESNPVKNIKDINNSLSSNNIKEKRASMNSTDKDKHKSIKETKASRNISTSKESAKNKVISNSLNNATNSERKLETLKTNEKNSDKLINKKEESEQTIDPSREPYRKWEARRKDNKYKNYRNTKYENTRKSKLYDSYKKYSKSKKDKKEPPYLKGQYNKLRNQKQIDIDDEEESSEEEDSYEDEEFQEKSHKGNWYLKRGEVRHEKRRGLNKLWENSKEGSHNPRNQFIPRRSR